MQWWDTLFQPYIVGPNIIKSAVSHNTNGGSIMAKVEVGNLKKLLQAQPDMKTQLALGVRAIVCNDTSLGDYASFMVLSADGDSTPEIVMTKTELRRFAQEILDKLKV